MLVNKQVLSLNKLFQSTTSILYSNVFHLYNVVSRSPLCNTVLNLREQRNFGKINSESYFRSIIEPIHRELQGLDK